MTNRLENEHLTLTINSDDSRWSLHGSHVNSPAIENAKVEFQYQRGYREEVALNRWENYGIEQTVLTDSPHGLLHQLEVVSQSPKDGLRFSLVFALPQDYPFLIWKLNVVNQGRHPILVDRLEMLSAGFVSQDLKKPLSAVHLLPLSMLKKYSSSPAPGEVSFFSNGWQSWSYTGVYRWSDKYRYPRLGPLRAPVITNPSTTRSRQNGVFSSDMFGVLGHTSQRTGILAGFLSQINHFGSIETWIGPQPPALRMWANGDRTRLDPGCQMSTDWAYLYFFHLDVPDPLSPYVEAVASQHKLSGFEDGGMHTQNFQTHDNGIMGSNHESGINHKVEDPPQIPSGWCSWYHFFQDISAEDIRENLAEAKRLQPDLPLQIFQIDDGYESQWGDWSTCKDTFPEGLSPLAEEIGSSGFTPGLWLAPFIVHPRSRLMSEHKDWLLRGRFNRPVNAGYFWGAFTTALDLTNRHALEHTAMVVHRAAHEWGFPYLKLDFLYAGALPGRRCDPTLTRAQVLRNALQTLRQAAGEQTTLLGCGCPLGSAVGLVDAMRISADVDTHWLPVHKGVKMRKLGDEGMPAARYAIHNTLTRAPLHRRWWINDPDCLLLRPDMELTLAEVQSLATTIAISGGPVILSDHLPDLPPERLRIAQCLLPPMGKRPLVLDWFDSQTPTRLRLDLNGSTGCWHLLALFNWTNETQDLQLQLSDFLLDSRTAHYAHEFWGGNSYLIRAGSASANPIMLKDIPAHGVALIAVRSQQPFQPQYLGSNLHVSQGMEVTTWEASLDTLNFRLQRPGRVKGYIDLGLPQPPTQAWIGSDPLTWFALDERRYRFEVEFEQNAEISIRLSKQTKFESLNAE